MNENTKINPFARKEPPITPPTRKVEDFSDIPQEIRDAMGIGRALVEETQLVLDIIEEHDPCSLDTVLAEIWRRTKEIPDRAKTNQRINNTLVKDGYIERVKGRKAVWTLVKGGE